MQGEDGFNGNNDTSWFKFNVETVLQVERREAIDHCFGQRPSRLLNEHSSDSLGSAYMLVYIPESQEAEIMSEVADEDIPRDLKRRLQLETFKKRMNEIRNRAAKLIFQVFYLLEGDVASFTHYSKECDLASPMKSAEKQSINCSIGMSTLDIILAVAEKLEVQAY